MANAYVLPRSFLSLPVYSETSGPQVLAAALNWINSVLLGSLGIALSTVAVALVGFAMLAGFINFGRSVKVILGSFILMGAAPIASGLLKLARGNDMGVASVSLPATAPPPLQVNPPPYDPYAGVAVPDIERD